MLLQTNSYIVPTERRAEHARLIRRFRQALARLGCDQFEVYEQVGANWSPAGSNGRYVQIMRFRDRQHQQAVQFAERNDPGSQQIIAEFCELINFPYQQQHGYFATGFYTSVLPGTTKQLEYQGPAAEGEYEEESSAEGVAEAEGEIGEEPLPESEHGAVESEVGESESGEYPAEEPAVAEETVAQPPDEEPVAVEELPEEPVAEEVAVSEESFHEAVSEMPLAHEPVPAEESFEEAVAHAAVAEEPVLAEDAFEERAPAPAGEAPFHTETAHAAEELSEPLFEIPVAEEEHHPIGFDMVADEPAMAEAPPVEPWHPVEPVAEAPAAPHTSRQSIHGAPDPVRETVLGSFLDSLTQEDLQPDANVVAATHAGTIEGEHDALEPAAEETAAPAEESLLPDELGLEFEPEEPHNPHASSPAAEAALEDDDLGLLFEDEPTAEIENAHSGAEHRLLDPLDEDLSDAHAQGGNARLHPQSGAARPINGESDNGHVHGSHDAALENDALDALLEDGGDTAQGHTPSHSNGNGEAAGGHENLSEFEDFLRELEDPSADRSRMGK